ncbi:hypothetical protein AKJ16_DCAP23039, partial [Drosera capensis]
QWLVQLISLLYVIKTLESKPFCAQLQALRVHRREAVATPMTPNVQADLVTFPVTHMALLALFRSIFTEIIFLIFGRPWYSKKKGTLPSEGKIWVSQAQTGDCVLAPPYRKTQATRDNTNALLQQ